MHDLADRVRKRKRIAEGADFVVDTPEKPSRRLGPRKVSKRPGFLCQRGVEGVSCNTNDFEVERIVSIIKREVLSKGASTGEEVLCEQLVDHYHMWSLTGILFANGPSAQNGNLHGIEKPGADDRYVRRGPILALLRHTRKGNAVRTG